MGTIDESSDEWVCQPWTCCLKPDVERTRPIGAIRWVLDDGE